MIHLSRASLLRTTFGHLEKNSQRFPAPAEGRSVKLSRDASVLVVGAIQDSSSGNGARPINVDGNHPYSGTTS